MLHATVLTCINYGFTRTQVMWQLPNAVETEAASLHAARPLYTQLLHRMRIAAVEYVTLPSVQENLEESRFACTGCADALAFQRIRFGFKCVRRHGMSLRRQKLLRHPGWASARSKLGDEQGTRKCAQSPGRVEGHPAGRSKFSRSFRLVWGDIGIMEKKKETVGVIWYILG